MSDQVDALLPRRWLAYSLVTGRPSPDPELSDGALAGATDAQLANALNLYGWPVRPASPRTHAIVRPTRQHWP